MTEFNLNHWSEMLELVVQSKINEAVEAVALNQANVVQSTVGQAVALNHETWEHKSQDFINTIQQKINVFEQHNREVRITFEQNIYEKVKQVLIEKTENLNLKIEEEINKKYKDAQEQFLAFKNRTDDDFQQRTMKKLDEKFESEIKALIVTLQANIFKELDQVMPVVRQMLNIDSDKNIGQEISVKKQIFLDKDLEDKLEGKINDALETAFNEKIVGSTKDVVEKATIAFKKILDLKLTELESQIRINKASNETMKALEQQIAKHVQENKVLKIKLQQSEKQAQSFEIGSYTNWVTYIPREYYSADEVKELCNTLKVTYNDLDDDQRHSKIIILSLGYHLVTETIRFPKHGYYIRRDFLNNSFRNISLYGARNKCVKSILEKMLVIVDKHSLNRLSFENKYSLIWTPA